MAFKIPKGLEKTIIGIASSLIISSTPLYALANETQNMEMTIPIRAGFEIGKYKTISLKYGKYSKEVFLKTNRGEKSLEMHFGINESETYRGKKIDTINLTPIDPGFSRLVIFLPKKMKIKDIEQEAYILPQEKFVKLKPLEKTTLSKKILKRGEQLIDSLTPLFVINPVKDAKDKLIESSSTREEEKYSKIAKNLENLISEEYTFKKIDFFPVDRIGYIERERKIKTLFETSELEGAGYIQAFLRPAIGSNTTPERNTGIWIKINLIIQGEKLLSYVNKNEIFIEKKLMGDSKQEVLNLYEIMKNRPTRDIGAHDPQGKRTIIYSYNRENLPSLKNKEISSSKNEFQKENLQNFKEKIDSDKLFLGIEKDLKKEGFSEETIIVIESIGKGRAALWNLKGLSEQCRKVEERGF